MNRGKQITYYQALTELEKIVNEIESEKIDLDMLAEKVKRAACLIKFCRSKLRSTEEDVSSALADIEDKTESGQGAVKDMGS
jgi:exodeoxyribonuclease VII small subunit